MKKFGLIGDPINKSKSPKLFKDFYQDKYSYELIEGSSFESVWEKFLKDYQGINITSPFKETAYKKIVSETVLNPKLDIQVSGPCYITGCTNLIVKTKKGYTLHNTDFDGFILSIAEAYFPGIIKQCRSLYKERFNIKVHQFVKNNIQDLFNQKPQALIIGCGATGKTAAIACADLGFDTSIINRSSNKVISFIEKHPKYKFIPLPINDFREAVKECDLIIYTIPAILEQNKQNLIETLDNEIFAGEESILPSPSKVIIDINYQKNIFSEQIQEEIKLAGCQFVNGEKFLYYQALTGFPLLTSDLSFNII